MERIDLNQLGDIGYFGGRRVSANTIDQLIEGLNNTQRENVLKALADAHVSLQDPFLAVMLALNYKIQQQGIIASPPAMQGGGWWKNIGTGILAGGVAAYVASVMLFNVVHNQADGEIARMTTQIREHGQMIQDVSKSGGELRYYAGNVNGKPVRILTINGGSAKPTDAFITAGGAATVILPALVNP